MSPSNLPPSPDPRNLPASSSLIGFFGPPDLGGAIEGSTNNPPVCCPSSSCRNNPASPPAAPPATSPTNPIAFWANASISPTNCPDWNKSSSSDCSACSSCYSSSKSTKSSSPLIGPKGLSKSDGRSAGSSGSGSSAITSRGGCVKTGSCTGENPPPL